jgi:hypothetical protein
VLGESFPQIIAAARGGAEWAWTRIYGDLAPPVLGYLRTRSAADAEDLMGEVFLQVVRDLNTFEGAREIFERGSSRSLITVSWTMLVGGPDVR